MLARFWAGEDSARGRGEAAHRPGCLAGILFERLRFERSRALDLRVGAGDGVAERFSPEQQNEAVVLHGVRGHLDAWHLYSIE